MSSFTDPLIVELNDDGVHWTLMEPFTYHVGDYPSGETIGVPVGYVTDFASIPRACWSIIGGPTGKYGKAAVIHDYLYDQGGRLSTKTYTKADADNIFKEAMEVLGVGNPRRWLMYQAVKRFGKGKF